MTGEHPQQKPPDEVPQQKPPSCGPCGKEMTTYATGGGRHWTVQCEGMFAQTGYTEIHYRCFACLSTTSVRFWEHAPWGWKPEAEVRDGG